MKKEDKNKFTILSFIISVFLLLLYLVYNTSKETRYCGPVISYYITNEQHSEKHIIFYNDSLKRNIDIKVNNQTYANISKGKFVCFDLNKSALGE